MLHWIIEIPPGRGQGAGIIYCYICAATGRCLPPSSWSRCARWQYSPGAATAALCRQHGISEQTLYRWKQKYGGLERGEATRLKVLEDENARLKRLVAEQALDNQILKDLLRRNA